MEITLTKSDLRELNKIKGMLQSPDTETCKLGYELLKNNTLIQQYFYNTWYVHNSKEIPVKWYFNKADNLKIQNEAHKEDSNYYEAIYWTLPLPILQAIINGEPAFKTTIHFYFEDDK